MITHRLPFVYPLFTFCLFSFVSPLFTLLYPFLPFFKFVYPLPLIYPFVYPLFFLCLPFPYSLFTLFYNLCTLYLPFVSFNLPFVYHLFTLCLSFFYTLSTLSLHFVFTLYLPFVYPFFIDAMFSLCLPFL